MAEAAGRRAKERLAAGGAGVAGGPGGGLLDHDVRGRRMRRDPPSSGVAAIFRSRLENGVSPRVFEDGGQRRDFVHVRDVARANLLALEAVDRVAAAAGHTVRGAPAAGAGGAEAGGPPRYHLPSGEPAPAGA